MDVALQLFLLSVPTFRVSWTLALELIGGVTERHVLQHPMVRIDGIAVRCCCKDQKLCKSNLIVVCVPVEYLLTACQI